MKIHLLILCFIAIASSFLLDLPKQQSEAQLPFTVRAAKDSQPKGYYEKVIHNYDPEAKCLDGSPGLLYVHQGGDTKNFLIFFQGGGLCGEQTTAKTLQSCYQRSKTILGTSKLWPDVLVAQGYLSVDPNVNKFANWTKFIFGYCDGSLHQGYSSSPVKYKDGELYFRGGAITRSHFNWINSKYNLKSATKVILTGASAGGVAVHLWNNYLRSYVKNPDSIYAVDDSGVFINAKTSTGNNKVQKMITNTFKIANINQNTPFAECNALHKNQQWKCLFIENGVSVIKGKFLIVNSQYDAWAIPNILQVKCLKSSMVGGATLSNCSKIEMGHIESYRSTYRQVMTKLLTTNANASIWSIACSNHVYACLNVFYNSQFQKVPEVVGSTVQSAIQTFVLQNQRVVKYDLEAWPSNRGCAK